MGKLMLSSNCKCVFDVSYRHAKIRIQTNALGAEKTQ